MTEATKQSEPAAMGATILWLVGNLLGRLTLAELCQLEGMIEKENRERARRDLLDTTAIIEDAVTFDSVRKAG